MSIKERLEAIAEALETASKQARLLAEEVDRGCTVTSASIGKAIRDNQRACLRKAGTMSIEADQSHL